MKRILRKGRNYWHTGKVDETGILVDGRDYYRLFYHAALNAREYILISGWQFDSETTLLRGEDEKEARGEVRFLAFLNSLCEAKPSLRIYILAWDFSIIFLLEREWLQEWIFNWMTNERLFFRFDSSHALGASQHQKFVVIDGAVAFAGGMDICAGRWDDRRHLAYNPSRINPDGRGYQPYHEVQSYLSGPLAERLSELFVMRWKNASGEDLVLPPARKELYLPEQGAGIPLAARRAYLSRTQAATLTGLARSVREIRFLYLDALHAAQKLIYLENQYFSSCAVYQALLDRMRDPERPKLQIVIILPRMPQALVEEIAVGISQAEMLRSLRDTAAATGHSLGIYYTAATGENGSEIPVYIHSKLLLVDDRFLTVGSANTTNRSMGLDTELNISWEATYRWQQRLIRSLRSLRADLLAEHTGMESGGRDGVFSRMDGLVKLLDSLADRPSSRLHRHTMEGNSAYMEWLSSLKFDNYIFDPEKTLIEEDLYELISSDKNSVFAGGITLLKKLLFNRNGALHT
ncbi:MAG: phospholipase [Alphaproteobacteria bacterium]|uniref:Phospholipase n=1 Tax=Candidatus Nitrobium versatile TaxID=2884831 RepID=A0A953JEW3_9BACT|nr:phospholipase [Candidatus Nitrobium versatile]